MMDETPTTHGGMQLRLLPPSYPSGPVPDRRLDAAEVNDFAAIVLFVLGNLLMSDKRRVLERAQRLLDRP